MTISNLPGPDWEIAGERAQVPEELAAAHSAQGQDRSSYQAVTGWGNLDFGFAKVTEGTGWRDPTFNANWANLANQGKHRGAYHFFHPGADPVAQARYFVSQVKAQGLLYGDMFSPDIEITVSESGQLVMSQEAAFRGRSHLVTADDSDSLTVLESVQRDGSRLSDFGAILDSGVYNGRSLDQVSLAFCKEILALTGPGYPLVVYTDLSVSRMIPSCSRYPLWMAWPQTGPPPTGPWAGWKFWQWGTAGNMDHDAYNGTPAQLQDWLNTFVPAPPGPRPRPGPMQHRTVTTPVSLHDAAARYGHELADVIWETVKQSEGGKPGPMQRKYFNQGDLRAKMAPGMSYHA